MTHGDDDHPAADAADGRVAPPRRARGLRATVVVLMLSVSSLLVACGSAQDERSTPAPVPTAETVVFASIGWDEEVAVTALARELLAAQGVESSVVTLDAGGIFEGLAAGSHDVYVDAWLPNTHADYMAAHGSELERLGAWLDEASLRWAVPSYVDATTIADVAALENQLGGRITGIEPSSGLMRVSTDAVLPAYDLARSFTVEDGTTATMLLALDRAIRDRQPIVVTLWEPHWAYDEYDLRNLEDPAGALGDADEAVMLARAGFSSDCPRAAALLSEIRLTQDQTAALENTIRTVGDDGPRAGVRLWLQDEDNLAMARRWTRAAGLDPTALAPGATPTA